MADQGDLIRHLFLFVASPPCPRRACRWFAVRVAGARQIGAKPSHATSQRHALARSLRVAGCGLETKAHDGRRHGRLCQLRSRSRSETANLVVARPVLLSGVPHAL